MPHRSTADRPRPKHGPRGLPLLYEDRDLLVVIKPAGLLTIGTERDKSRTAHYLLNDYVRKGDPKSRNRVYVVHRLDQDTSGVLLFAKSEQAKVFLQDHWEQTEKHYLAVVHGRVTPAAGTISTYLAENSAQRVYSTPDAARGKLSHTAYTVVREGRGFSLLDVHLLTGRKHQIRIHMAHLGHPIVGDKLYGCDERAYLDLAGSTFSALQWRPRLLLPYQALHGGKVSFKWGSARFEAKADPEPWFMPFVLGEPLPDLPEHWAELESTSRQPETATLPSAASPQ